MATITNRGPYQWRVQVRRHGHPAQSRTFNSKAEADAWAAMTESEMARGVWLSRGEAERTTLHEALDRYEREVTPSKRSAEQERRLLRNPAAIGPAGGPRTHWMDGATRAPRDQRASAAREGQRAGIEAGREREGLRAPA